MCVFLFYFEVLRDDVGMHNPRHDQGLLFVVCIGLGDLGITDFGHDRVVDLIHDESEC